MNKCLLGWDWVGAWGRTLTVAALRAFTHKDGACGGLKLQPSI